MKSKFSTSAIILLAIMNVLTLVYATQAVHNTGDISQKLKDNPPKIVYVQAKDGYTPVKGIDYFDGAQGINAMSYNVTNKIIKEVPLAGTTGNNGNDGLPGKDGTDGKDAPIQELRVNSSTGDLESKLTSDSFWTTLVACSDYKTECP